MLDLLFQVAQKTSKVYDGWISSNLTHQFSKFIIFSFQWLELELSTKSKECMKKATSKDKRVRNIL